MERDLSQPSMDELLEQVKLLKAENEQLRKMRAVQKTSEKMLFESRFRVNTILRAIPDVIFRFDKDDILLDFHAPNTDLHQIPGDKLKGKHISEVFAKDLMKKTLLNKEKALVLGGVEVFEQKVLSGTGIFFEEVRIVSGDNQEYFAIFRDITKRKRAELQLDKHIAELKENKLQIEERAEELKVLNYKLMESKEEFRKLNASKDKFFSIIAHDLKNPLFSLLGLLEILVERVEGSEDDENRQIVMNMNKSAKSLYYLLENLLQWSRIQTGKIEYSPLTLDLKMIFEVVSALYKMTAVNKKISLSYECPENLKVYADENLLNTVLRNLISNALKFTPEGGEVLISAEVSGSRVKISVSDTGVGIPQENLEKLFKIDSQVSTSGTNNEPGTGLGLVLCREFVKMNKGELKVKSILGKGTTFSFTVPESMK